MFIKLRGNIINLDLVKKISDVKAYLIRDGDTSIHEILEAREEARWLNISVNGTEQQTQYTVLYGFEISYLKEKYPERVITGESRRDARKYIESFSNLINNNQPIIHEVKIL
tara:strand:- start:210 stop:545 length:336 start_codon:yes stop_codon:yes gene_type:complete